MDKILMYRDAGIVWTALVDKKTKKPIVHIVCEGKRQERFETHLLAKQRVEWLQEVRRAGSVQAAMLKRKQGAVAAC